MAAGRQGGEPAAEADPELIVTNSGRRYTGVSATTEALLAPQAARHRLWLAGRPLGQWPLHSFAEAVAISRRPPAGRPFRIWHVRRNNELQRAWLARDILRLPIRIVFTSAAIRLHSPYPRFLIARADAVVPTSETAAQFVPHVAAVIPHGVDTARFRPPDDREAEWVSNGLPGRYGIGIVGRVRPEKGTDLFVDAMVRLLPHHPQATALVIGAWKPSEARFTAMLANRVEAAGLAERIRFLGEVSQEDMPAWYRRLSVVVAAGRYEGYGMTVLEAMASGAATVATRTGAYPTMIEEGRSGFITPVGDAGALAEAVGTLLAAPGQAAAFGEHGRSRAEGLFSVEREADALADVYERLWRGERF